MRERRGVRRSGGRSDRLCPEKESELDELNAMAILAACLFVAFWLGFALCYVAVEPLLWRREVAKVRVEMESIYRARIRQLEDLMAIRRIGDELPTRAHAAADVMDAEVE